MNAIISWFAKNSVAANLSMVLIVVSGIMVMPLIERKIIPQITFDIIEIKVVLPGAGPTQVERTVTRRVEQALTGLDGVLDVTSQAKKNVSVTSLEISNKVSLNEVINKVRARMNAANLPKEASSPIVSEIFVVEPVLGLAVSGDIDLEDLNAIARYISLGLKDLSNVSQVYVRDSARRNFVVEVSESSLQRYRVSFSELVRKLKAAASDITGATLKTDTGEVSVIGDSELNSAAAMEALAVRSQADGARITVMDLANVRDSVIVNDRSRTFDGKNVVYIGINRSQNEDLLKLADQVQRFVAKIEPNLPPGVGVEITTDISKEVKGRIDMLTSNAVGGFFLVLIVLLLFMNLRLSFWTSLGIPISFLGAFFVLYYWGGSLNMVSLFAFILVLGIVVDDAIIVGESIYSQHEKNHYGVSGSIEGALEVARPVLFAVVTTMVAFSPMLFMPGEEGRLVFVVPVVVIAVLAFSLIESLLILPSHLSTIDGQKNELIPRFNKIQAAFSGFLDRIIKNFYAPNLEKALLWRYTCIVFFFMIFFISIALMAFRWVGVEVVSKIESDMLVARLEMITDTPIDETVGALKKLELAAFQVKKEFNSELGFAQIKHIDAALDNSSDLKATVSIYLNAEEKREISSDKIAGRLREVFGEVPHLKSLYMKTSLVGKSAEIDIELSHIDLSLLKEASRELRLFVNSYDGVSYSWDTLSQGKREVGFSLKPEANDLGVNTAQVAAQIRQAFHGEGLQILDESGNRVSVRVQYPENESNSLWFLENLQISLKDGSSVPLYSVADLEYRQGPAVIDLHNGKRSIRVKAKLGQSASEAQIMASLRQDFLNDLRKQYPGMSWKRAGGQKRSRDVLDYLLLAYPISLLVMYLLMATLFASYTQPLMVMGAIPFGIVGALIGHLIMGVGVTLWSLVGIIAVSGVVVNDNLVLVDRINRSRESGMPLLDAIREAGAARFRPIVLTSITTFLGLAPLMLEESVQAQFLIPMAVSLSFGVVFATVISLILVPAFYAVLYDLEEAVAKQNISERLNAFVRKQLKSDV